MNFSSFLNSVAIILILSLSPFKNSFPASIQGQITNSEPSVVELYQEYSADNWSLFDSTFVFPFNGNQYNFNVDAQFRYRLKFINRFDDSYTYYGETSIFEEANSITVSENENLSINANLTNIQSGNVSGVITDTKNQKISNVLIIAQKLKTDGTKSQFDSREIRSDSNGNYILRGLSGNYFIKTDRFPYLNEYYSNSRNESEATMLVVDKNKDNIDFELDLNPIIQVKVKDREGNILSDVEIDVYKKNSSGSYDHFSTSTFYNDGINNKIEFLIPGTYKIQFTKNGSYYEFYNDSSNLDDATEIEVNLNDELMIDVVLDKFLERSLSGKVVDINGMPVKEALVSIFNINEDPSSIYNSDSVLTNDLGEYVFNNLKASNYQISASKNYYYENYYGNTSRIEESQLININGLQDITNINIEIDKTAKIYGVINDGKDLGKYSQVLLYYFDSEYFEWVENSNNIFESDTGNYVIENLYEGLTYRIGYRYFDSEGIENIVFSNGATNVENAEDIIVDRNEEREINIDIQRNSILDIESIPTLTDWSLLLLIISLFLVNMRCSKIRVKYK